jgi:hypothetical protein
MPMRRDYVPTVGEEVLLLNHLGTFMVEEVDSDSKTASLRVLRSGVLMKDVEWRTIWPLDDNTRAVLTDIFNSQEFKQLLSKRNDRNDVGE